jgi:hypothetical protein
MMDLFFMGGPLFMGILTIGLVALIVTISMNQTGKGAIFTVQLAKEIGILSFVIGMFAQLIGLYQMFSVVEQMGKIAPNMLAGGLKVSLITTLYGFLILIIALVYSLLKNRLAVKQ